MKQIMYVMALLVMMASVTASFDKDYDVDVDCGDSKWYNPLGKYCEAYEVQSSVSSVASLVQETDDYISANTAQWSTDRKGVSFTKVKELLFGDYLEMLKGLFVTKDDLALSEARIITNNGELGSIDCYAARLRADQTNKEYVFGEVVAYPGVKLCFEK